MKTWKCILLCVAVLAALMMTACSKSEPPAVSAELTSAPAATSAPEQTQAPVQATALATAAAQTPAPTQAAQTEPQADAETDAGTQSGTQTATGTQTGTEAAAGTQSGTEATAGTQTGAEAATGTQSGAEAAAGTQSGTEAADTQAGTEAAAGTQTATSAQTAAETDPSQLSLSSESVLDVMCEPSGILFLEDGTMLVTDVYGKTVLQVTAGVSQIYAGAETVEDLYGEPLGGYNDAALEESYFKLPWAIAPFLDGYAVTDTDNNAVRLLLPDGVQTLNAQTKESLNVTDLGVAFDHPTGLAADDEGNLYVSDSYQNAVRKIDPDGNVTTLTAALNTPMGLCWKDGTLYVAEAGSNRIIRIADGRVMVLAGSRRNGMDDGPSARASFSSPQGIAVDDDGTVYVADTANSAIRRIRDGVVETLLCRDITDPEGYIPISPVGLAIADGKLYVCDSYARGVFTMDLPQ